MNKWPCGTPKSMNNAFDLSGLLPRSKPEPKKPGPKTAPKSIALPGSRALDIRGRKLNEPTHRSQFFIDTPNAKATYRRLGI